MSACVSLDTLNGAGGAEEACEEMVRLRLVEISRYVCVNYRVLG